MMDQEYHKKCFKYWKTSHTKKQIRNPRTYLEKEIKKVIKNTPHTNNQEDNYTKAEIIKVSKITRPPKNSQAGTFVNTNRSTIEKYVYVSSIW